MELLLALLSRSLLVCLLLTLGTLAVTGVLRIALSATAFLTHVNPLSTVPFTKRLVNTRIGVVFCLV